MHTNISDFVIGKQYGGVYICKTHAIKSTKTDSKYLDMQIVDKTGEINGKCWTIPANVNVDDIVDGDFIALVLVIESYQGKMQAKITNLKILESTDVFDKSEIVPVAPESADSMYLEIVSTINDMENYDLQKLCNNIITENKSLLMNCPGAKSMHHAVVSGLLQHVTGMLKLGKSICGLYPFVNSDLLLSGIILHDICKLREFSLGPIGLCTDYSKEGKLIGHITMGVSYIERKCLELGIDDEIKTLMMHMILSHHGQPEYGSAVKPMTMEAMLLNIIDNIDAKVYMCESALKDIPAGTFTDKIFGMENVQLYKPNLGVNEGE